LITLFPHEPAYHPIAGQLQSVMVYPWNNENDLMDKCGAILAGPGLAYKELPEDLKNAVRRYWRAFPVPVIIDASALDWLSQGAIHKDAARVITPHPGEAARLLRTNVEKIQQHRGEAVRELSRRYGNCWVVLKGPQTLVGSATGEIFANSSGNPNLAQGGSGDVLSGYIAGLLAQPQLQQDVCRTLRYAVWQHGATADWLDKHQPNWVVEDLVKQLGNVSNAA
jgi:NAD(P)H-hydrate epimerase